MPQERTAAVGASLNDTSLLTAASLRFFVGEGRLPSVPDVRRRPNADMWDIAREVESSRVHRRARYVSVASSAVAV